ncbi:MAG TPA: hypothetical protein VGB97_01500 [Candidatus Paceibacterota bacterium]|jgi:hypothetical protein
MSEPYTPVLAQLGTTIDLVVLPKTLLPKVGKQFTRDPQVHKRGDWTIVKVFEGEDGTRMMSLIGLIGLDAATRLFAVEVREPVSS